MPENKKAGASSWGAQLKVLWRQGRLTQKQHDSLVEAILRERNGAVADAVSNTVEIHREEIESLRVQISELVKTLQEKIVEADEGKRYDSMTGLLNKVSFLKSLGDTVGTEQRGRWLAVGVLDLTVFKWYNDAFGHEMGDDLIKTVAWILKTHIREQDLHRTARLGGDEFGFYLVGFSKWQDAEHLANRVKRAIAGFHWEALEPNLGIMPLSADIGIVCLRLGPVEGRRGAVSHICDELMAEADKQMYEAKKDRANRAYMVRRRLEGGSLIADEETEEGR